MDTLFNPNENDFRWSIREALKECLENIPGERGAVHRSAAGAIITQKEIEGIFHVSLVTSMSG